MTAAPSPGTTEMPAAPPRPARGAGGISLPRPAAETALGPCSHGAIAVYTLDEAAAILRVKPSWLERRAAARDIPFTMLGGSYHFTADHLAAIVTQHENRPAALGYDAAEHRPPAPRRPAVSPRTGDLQARPLRPRPRRAA
jgi:hypothetical protein